MGIKRMMEILEKNKSVSLVLLTALFVSCSTRITVTTPSSRFISPEAAGETLKGNVNLFLSRGTDAEVDLTDATTDKALNFERNEDLANAVGLGANIGIIRNLDFLVLSNGDHYPLMFGLKYQIVGDAKNKATKDNHSLSIVGLMGSAVDEQENDDAVEITPTDDEAKVDLDIDSKEVALIYGYRFAKDALFYLGPNYTVTTFKGELKTENVALNGQMIDYWGDSFGATIGFMFDFGSNTKITVEGSHQKLNWDKTTSQTFNYLTAGVGFSWY